MKTMTLLYCVFYLSILHLFSSVLSAEIINNEPVIKELPLRYKKTIDLNYDDVSTEFLINDLNKRYNLFLKPNFVYEKMQEIEVNGKVYRLPETFLDEEAMRMPVSIHLADVPYWKMVAEVAKSTNSRLHIDREVVYFDKSDRYYSLGNSYTTAGIYLISLKKDEQSHAVLEFVSFRQDIGDDGELKLDKVTINYQGIKKDVSGSIEEWNTPSGLFLKWISNDPVEFKEGMILSGDILGEVVTKRYYINNLLGDTVLEKNNLKVKVKTTNYEDLGSTTKFGFIKIQPGQALWTIRVLLKDVSEYGLTKEEYQFIKECFIECIGSA
ncbi:MAG TPA: hypothetical protein PKB02_05985 [Anaerohalosphaeraceae bacterium]|nr:hypothetical protein [Anaerohalosphaeraceae bacterium]